MSSVSNKQNNLLQWLQSVNCLEVFTTNDILNGMLVYNIIKNVSQNTSPTLKQISASNSTLSRVSNWNILTEQLKKFNIALTQQNKSKIVNGNQDFVIQIVSQLKQFHQKKQKSSEVDIAQIDPKKDVTDTKSLLQMLLILIMKNFHLSSKQSVALLSNESKYLAHILTKGLKGQFKGIETFILQMGKYIQKIVQFCKQNPENIVFFLRSIKPALISKSETISSLCIRFFNKYLLHYKVDQRIQIFQTHLLSTYLLILKRHQQMQSEVIFGIFETIGSLNTNLKQKQKHQQKLHRQQPQKKQQVYKSILLTKIYDTLASDSQKHSLTLTIIKTFGQRKKLQEYMKIEFFSKRIINSIQSIRKQQYCLGCIDIVILINEFCPNIFSLQDEQTVEYSLYKPQQLSTTLIENIKSLDSTSTTSSHQISLITQFFTLLQQFGKQKHFIAPSLYKLLLEKFTELNPQQTNNYKEIYDVYITNFIEVIQQFNSIPWSAILQHIINSKKIETHPAQTTQIQLQFYLFILNNDNIDIKFALLIYDSVSRLFMETYHLAGLIIKIMVKIVQLFSKEQPIVQQLSLKMIKVCLAIHHANVKKLSQKRKSLTGDRKISDQDAVTKIKNNSIQFLILKTAKLNFQTTNNKIQPLVAFSYINLKDKPQFSKGFKIILNSIGNFSEIVDKYQKQIKRAQEQAKQLKEKEKVQKIEKQKQKALSSRIVNKQQSKSRYEDDNFQLTRKDQTFNDDLPVGHLLTNKRQSISLHNQNRSFNYSQLGVTPAAQKGIQKYQKVYLQKIQKQDLQKIKKIQEQERFQLLKKLYKKKMMSNGIEIKGQTDQIQYIFQFDSQQNKIIEKHFLKVPYYTNQNEQDRDMKAVQKLLKSYQKALKVLFSIYSGQKKANLPQNFDQIAQKNSIINSTGIYKLLKEFSFQDYISNKQVQFLTQKVNIQLNPTATDYQFLDFDGFVEFIKQASFLMFTRPPKDLRGQPLALMLQQTFSNFKLFANENRINDQIFQEPSSIFFSETQAVAEINKKLLKNPDYILPQGYKKIVDKKISFQYGIFLEALSPTYKVVFQVVDQLLFKVFGVHSIQPFTKQEKITRARPALFVAERIKMDIMPSKHIPIKMKKQIAKIPVTLRPLAKDCAIVLDEIIQAIQLGHTSIGQKHFNKTQLERKKIEQEERKQDEILKRKRQARNRQAKSAIEGYKQKKTQKQKQVQSKKQEQERKQRQEKQKRQKQQKQLKKKLQQYNKKRKQDEEEKLKKKKQQQQKQKKQRQRLKQLNQQTKKRIQEEKKRRQQEQNSKKTDKQIQQKRLKDLQKKKLQQSQILKKKMVEDFRLKKSQVRDSSASGNKSMIKETNKGSKKNLQSYQQGEDNTLQ